MCSYAQRRINIMAEMPGAAAYDLGPVRLFATFCCEKSLFFISAEGVGINEF